MFEYNDNIEYNFTLETPLEGDDYITVTDNNGDDN